MNIRNIGELKMDRTDLTAYCPGAPLMSRLPLLGFSAAGLLLLVLCSGSASADETVDVLTIADATGDWGFPSPYGHYSRGPGYIRMSLIFDTLVWKDENGYVPGSGGELAD